MLSELLVIIIFTVFYGKFGDITVDSFREVYIPQEMLSGKTIYKDIFVIYPPLAYLINAFLMKITTLHNIVILNFAGLISTMGIVYITYKISNLFLEKIYGFSINLFIIAGLVLSPNVFNSFLPYSFGILYGILFVLISLYYALNKKFPIAYLFYSLALLSKYEFLLLLPLLIFFSKKDNWKWNLAAFSFPIILTILILLIQGLRLTDISATLNILNTMSGTKTLYWFYSVMGLVFRLETIPIYLTNILKFLLPINWVRYQEILIWACPIILLGTCIKIRHLKKDEIFLLVATILVSSKVFFALTLQSYGVYFLPLALISLYLILPNKIRKFFSVLLIIWAFIIGSSNINTLSRKNMNLPIITQYIQENTSEQNKVLVYPEGLFLNVKTHRKSDDKFYSLIPLYVETFGEDLIITRLKRTKPKYIIISDYDTSAYYFKSFGKDYAISIYEYIKTNYEQKAIIRDIWNYEVFEYKS